MNHRFDFVTNLGVLFMLLFCQVSPTAAQITQSTNQPTSYFSSQVITNYNEPINGDLQEAPASSQTIYLPLIIRQTGAPNFPSNPNPIDGDSINQASVTLSWSGGEPGGGVVTYDVYFQAGNSSPTTRVSSGQTTTSFNTGNLSANTTYYWRIVSINERGVKTTGPVWHFTTLVPESLTAVSAGGIHTCLLTSAGGVRCWGDNAFGQIGDGSTTNRLTPVDVSGLSGGVMAIATGYDFSCALTTLGGVRCWGNNTYGQLGDGTTINHSTPADVSGLTGGVTAITAGYEHACALVSGGGTSGSSVKCWGLNSAGQLGDGTLYNRLTPVSVSGLSVGITSIDAGSQHTCALNGSGALQCWGYNKDGQVGDGTNATRLNPVGVNGLPSGVTSIALGGSHTCAVITGGKARCWGYNDGGQVGDGTSIDRLTPVDVSSLSSGVTLITGGGAHTCAIIAGTDGKCWGDNDFGQLGDSTSTDQLFPESIMGLPGSVLMVSAGHLHTCALVQNKGAMCWGNNDSGQLGNDTTQSSLVPVEVLTNIVNHAPNRPSNPEPAQGATDQLVDLNLTWSGGDPDGNAVTYDVYFEAGDSSPDVKVASAQADTHYNPGRLVSNTTYYWQVIATDKRGLSANGPVWRFTTGNRAPNTPVDPFPLQNAVNRSTSSTLNWTGGDPDGDPVTYDVYFEEGNSDPSVLVSSGQTATSFVPTTLLYNGTYYWKVVAKDSHGLTVTGPVWNFRTAFKPAYVRESLITRGSAHTCAIDAYSSAWCWGSNFAGQLGRKTIDKNDHLTPVGTDLPNGVLTIAAGSAHTCAITKDGALKCWGRNASAELGQGNTSTYPSTPQDVPGLSQGVVAVAAGGYSTCAVTGSGGLMCWGDNTYGKLGSGSSSGFVAQPTPVVGLSSGVIAVTVGSYHTCALTRSGGVKCWGGNSSGNLGDGTTTDHLTPVDVSGLTSGVVAISASGFSTCALTDKGGVKCWGNNVDGSLGDGTTTNRLQPVDVTNLTSGVAAISGTCALTTTGGAKCWGNNDRGQIGDGTRTNRLTPVNVYGLSSGVSAIGSPCAFTDKGDAMCWGSNYNGEVGDNTTIMRLTPVRVWLLGV